MCYKSFRLVVLFSSWPFLTPNPTIDLQLILNHIALLPRTKAQKCTFMPRLGRCNCYAEHFGQGTCSRSLRGSQSGIRTCDPPYRRHRTLPLSHHVRASVLSPSCLLPFFFLLLFLVSLFSILRLLLSLSFPSLKNHVFDPPVHMGRTPSPLWTSTRG